MAGTQAYANNECVNIRSTQFSANHTGLIHIGYGDGHAEGVNPQEFKIRSQNTGLTVESYYKDGTSITL